MQTVNIGVLGVGRMGQRHCRVYSNLRHAHLAGVCDANRAQGEKVAGQYDVPYFATLEEMLKHVDAVSVVTPTPLHYEQARRCLDYGAHVLVEKPLTETLAQAERLAELAETSGRVALVGHLERFNTAYIELKNVLDGEPQPLALNFRRLSPREGSNLDVDVVLDLMIHDANLVLDLMGRLPDSVEADGLMVFSGSLDHVIARLRYQRGPLITLTASRITEHKIRAVDVTAPKSYIECDLMEKTLRVHRHTIGEYLSHNHRGVKYRQESIVERIAVPIFEPLFLELQHFVDCILEGQRPHVTARDGLNAMRLVDMVRQAALKSLAVA